MTGPKWRGKDTYLNLRNESILDQVSANSGVMRYGNKMNRIIRLLLCIFITVFAFKIQSAYPSTPTPERKGKIAGLVLDINDARVANAKITFGSGPSQSSVITGIAGEFEIELPMSDNRYSFTVQANGFCNFEGYAPLLHNKATEMINIHLEGVAIDGECKCSRRKS